MDCGSCTCGVGCIRGTVLVHHFMFPWLLSNDDGIRLSGNRGLVRRKSVVSKYRATTFLHRCVRHIPRMF
jgi:hypothetical protein